LAQNDPTHIQVGSSDALTANADIRQHIVKINNDGDKMRLLENEIFPELQRTGGTAIIFTKMKKTCDWLHRTLQGAGAPIVALHGDMDQPARDKALHAFKTGRAKVLVATDVAQRGLDIKNVQFVVNYDVPSNIEDYVHRIGRTGRAGEKGDSYTCLGAGDEAIARQIMQVFQKAGQAITPELKEIAEGNSWGFGGGGGGGGKGSWGSNEPNGQWGGKYAEGSSAPAYGGYGDDYGGYGKGGGKRGGKW
jgi:ATP-dependent RNA helicase DDX5/DBP2